MKDTCFIFTFFVFTLNCLADFELKKYTVDFVTHGNTLLAFEKAGLNPKPRWKEPTKDYDVGEGTYTFILKGNIKFTQDAFNISISLNYRDYSKISTININPARYSTIDESVMAGKALIKLGAVPAEGYDEWIENFRKGKGTSSTGAGIIIDRFKFGYGIRFAMGNVDDYSTRFEVSFGWDQGVPQDMSKFPDYSQVNIDWDVPKIMASVPKPEGLDPLRAYMGIIGVEKLWKMGMKKPIGAELSQKIEDLLRQEAVACKQPIKPPIAATTTQPKSSSSWLIWLVRSVITACGIYLLYLIRKSFKNT